MSLSTLPYDVVRSIVLFLDPDPRPGAGEAPSVTRKRREIGRTVALIARNFRSAGTELVWRNVVVGFHRNPDLLERILREGWMASHVKQIHILVGQREEHKALQLDLTGLLDQLYRLNDCVLSTSPDVAERVLAGAAAVANVSHISFLEVDTTVSPSTTLPRSVLAAFPLFTGAKRLALSLRLPANAVVPAPLSAPVLRTRFLSFEIEDLKPDAHPAAATLLSSFLSLFAPVHVQNVFLVSDVLPLATMRPFFQRAQALDTLTLSTSQSEYLSLLSGVTSLLPELSGMRTLRVLLRAHNARPPLLGAGHPVREALFAALAHPTSCVSHVAFDTDMGDASEFESALLELTARGSKLWDWCSVEWEAMVELRREMRFARMQNCVREAAGVVSRDRWVLVDGFHSEEDE